MEYHMEAGPLALISGVITTTCGVIYDLSYPFIIKAIHRLFFPLHLHLDPGLTWELALWKKFGDKNHLGCKRNPSYSIM